MAPPALSVKNASTFRIEHRVTVTVRAPASVVWSMLTDAAGFPAWNSTVTSIDGPIQEGRKLSLRVPTSERTFTPTVTELVPEARMVWSDGMAPMFKGVRTFTLADRGDGATDFTMEEVLAGIMLPLVKGSLPDFGPVFDQYAHDLKVEAERRAAA